MNWLGKKIQKNVSRKDIVLDIGCGIMQATTDSLGARGNLKCKTILGVDLDVRYLDKIKKKYPTIISNAANTKIFPDKSYDVVLCTDVLEHLEKSEALELLKEMERIARKYIIAYTPKEFHLNEDHAEHVWGMSDNPLQKHKCLVSQEEFTTLGYEVETTDIDHNTFAIKKI